jgi:hypothetical protein
MFWLRLIYSRLYGLLRKNRIEQEMDDEMRFHLLMRTRENIERGMRPDEAEREARRRFGNVGHIKDLARDIKGGGFMETLLQDLRYGARMLTRSPGFTVVAALSLVLGIGVNTSVFTLIYSLAWRPLPVKDPASVVNIHQTVRGNNYGRRSEGGGPISYPEYLNYRDQTRSFAGLAAYAEETLTMTGVETERINAQMVTDNYFSVLGGEAILGRVFVPNECQTPGACPQVVLSYDFWQRRLGSDPNVIGKALILNRQPYTVVGVAARSWSGMGMNGANQFDLPVITPDVWVPLMMRAQLAPERDLLSNRDCSCHSVVGRLKNGVSLKQAQADMDVAAGQLDQDELATNNRARRTNVSVMPGTALNIPEIRGFVIPSGIALSRLSASCWW